MSGSARGGEIGAGLLNEEARKPGENPVHGFMGSLSMRCRRCSISAFLPGAPKIFCPPSKSFPASPDRQRRRISHPAGGARHDFQHAVAEPRGGGRAGSHAGNFAVEEIVERIRYPAGKFPLKNHPALIHRKNAAIVTPVPLVGSFWIMDSPFP